MHTNVYGRMHTSKHLHTYVYTYIYMYLCRASPSDSVRTFVCRSSLIFEIMWAYLYVCICVCLCTCVCVYTYVHIYTHTNPTEVTAKENAERYNGIGGRGDCYTCEQEESL